MQNPKIGVRYIKTVSIHIICVGENDKSKTQQEVMMITNKITAIFCALALVLSLVGCRAEEDENDTQTEQDAPPDITDAIDTSDPAPDPDATDTPVECVPTGDENTEAACGDHIDNDCDGYIDCDDWDCDDFCSGGDENTDALCSDEIDNDDNGHTDCDDFGCSRNPCVTVCPRREDTNEECSDDIDNDDSGYADCDDWNCSRNINVTVCPCKSGDECDDASCDDGIDNDDNGYTDCDDFACSRNPHVTVCNSETTDALCDDDIDNDDNGYTNCDDFGCTGTISVTICCP